MDKFKEQEFIGSILVFALNKSVRAFDKTKQILIDADIISENDDGSFEPSSNSISLKEIVKIEQILDKQLLTIPSKQEWLIINRRRKLEKLKNISNEK